MGTAVSRVGSLGVFACIGVAWPAAAQPVDIELVLAVDVSISVDGSELDLQRQGYADAFRAPDVIAAIAANAGGVAVSIVQWAGQGQQRTAVDWTLLTDADFEPPFRRNDRQCSRRGS